VTFCHTNRGILLTLEKIGDGVLVRGIAKTGGEIREVAGIDQELESAEDGTGGEVETISKGGEGGAANTVFHFRIAEDDAVDGSRDDAMLFDEVVEERCEGVDLGEGH